jgi:hypothetical protein
VQVTGRFQDGVMPHDLVRGCAILTLTDAARREVFDSGKISERGGTDGWLPAMGEVTLLPRAARRATPGEFHLNMGVNRASPALLQVAIGGLHFKGGFPMVDPSWKGAMS